MAEADFAEEEQQRRLRRSRALATGLLGLSGAAFLATLAVRDPGFWVLLLRAVSEASLVGGLADWFAVTALFRRPLGLPIPHTAILPANKNRIGEGLARFLERHFLTRELLLAELQSLQLAARLADWLAQRRNAAALGGEIARALPFLLHAVGDRQINAFIGRALGAQLRAMDWGPVIARLGQIATAAGYHYAVLDAVLDEAREFLLRNREGLLDAVAERRRGWIPRALNRRIAAVMLNAATELLGDLRDPHGAARHNLLRAIEQWAAELTASPQRFAAFGTALVSQPQLQAWIAEIWERSREALLADLAAPSSRVRRGLALTIASAGEALRDDPAMRVRLDAAVEALLLEALPWREQLIRFIAGVVNKWEPRAFSDRIERAVGADLQFIRINGTIVGGLVGGGLYLVSVLAR